MSRYFIDTEFAESPGQLDLISIGVVSEDGREFYAVAADGWSEDRCSDWVKANVLPNLGEGHRMTRAEIRDALLDFIGRDTPEFWAYYADYDWVAFCWLFGAMVDLPKGWPMHCKDLLDLELAQTDTAIPRGNDRHNALDDARWCANGFRLLTAQATPHA